MDLFDFKKINSDHSEQIKLALSDEFLQNDLILGKAVSEFEDAFARFNHASQCISVNSGLDALMLTLEYIKCRTKRRNIIVQGHSYFATFSSIISAGFKIIAVDTDFTHNNINIGDVKAYINSDVAAVLNVRLYGRVGPSAELLEICKAHGAFLLEDCAQAHGVTVNAEDLFKEEAYFQAYSFYPTKNLGALGDGGAILTGSSEANAFLRAYRDYGREDKFKHKYVGVNSRLDSIQARVLSLKLRSLNSINDSRRRCARLYDEYLDHSKLNFNYQSQKVDDCAFSPHIMAVFSSKKSQVLNALEQAGIPYGHHYNYSVKNFEKLFGNQLESRNIKHSTLMANQQISLPHGCHMDEEMIKSVCLVINNA